MRMRRAILTFLLELVLCSGLFSEERPSGNAGGEPPVRLAVIGGQGKRAPAEHLLALLEVSLSKESQIVLLDRAEIQKVLDEQKLGAVGLINPSLAAAIGGLLAADVMLFAERATKTGKPLVRLRIVESRTGIALCSFLGEEKEIVGNDPATLRLVRAATAEADQDRDGRVIGLATDDGQCIGRVDSLSG